MAMAMNPFLLGFIAFLVLVTILLLFGQASFCRTWLPCVPFLHDLLFSHLPQALYHLSPPWIHRMAARCEAAADSRNPVLQVSINGELDTNLVGF